MTNPRVKVHYRKTDLNAPKIDGGPGYGFIHPTIETYYLGILQGYGVMYEELRDGVGQYTIAIVLNLETMHLDWTPLHNVEFLQEN